MLNCRVACARKLHSLSGKPLEVPAKKLLLGGDPAKGVNRVRMSNPDSFDSFLAHADARAKT